MSTGFLTENDAPREHQEKAIGRRRLLKALRREEESLRHPVIEIGALPVHAQVSPVISGWVEIEGGRQQ